MNAMCPKCSTAIDVSTVSEDGILTCPTCGGRFRVKQPTPAPVTSSSGSPVMPANPPVAAPPIPPAGHAPYPGSPVVATPVAGQPVVARPVSEVHSLTGRRNAFTVFAAILLVLCIVGIWSSMKQLELLERAKAPDCISKAEADENDQREATIAIIYLGVFFIGGILYLRWVHLAYKNLPGLGVPASEMHSTPAGSVAWYFCPIANLWKPYQCMQDIVRGSSSPGDRRNILSLWWTIWVINLVVSQVYSQMSSLGSAKEGTALLDHLFLTTKLDIASEIAKILSLLVTIRLMSHVTRMQTAKQQLQYAEQSIA